MTIESEAITPEVIHETRPLYWSVRREVWENRSLWIAPLVVAGIVLFAMLINTTMLPGKMRAAGEDPVKVQAVINPYMMTPAPIMFTTFIVALFYALDALYGERRERSILFWKSLPVSDRTTVLSKMLVMMVVLPLIAIALSIAVRATMLMLGTVVLLANGMSPGPLWGGTRWLVEPIVMVYGMTIHELWFAPIYAWLLLVSAWSRRAPWLWAFLPLVVPIAIERMLFGTKYFGNMLRYRFEGAMSEGFTYKMPTTGVIDRLAHLDPLKFLSAGGLWLGLLFAAACLAAAVRLRRAREPI